MFRPCIDLHEGKVKQIVGSTLTGVPGDLQTNFVSVMPPEYYAELYKKDGLTGGHVIMLGPGNTEAAKRALRAFPGGLQVGGGITPANADMFLDAGASHVIVTSYVFHSGKIDWDRLREFNRKIGATRLVLDLSCRKRMGQYYVVTDRWQKFTEIQLNGSTLDQLSAFCDEFLVHAVDIEGLCQGIDLELASRLADWSPRVITYAGGVSSISDLFKLTEVSKNRLDVTIGSALDIFGGRGVKYSDAVKFNQVLKNHGIEGLKQWLNNKG
jgi:phosphoribosylformimino-5-aminoimidazole carboxamide ribotide isomerase